MAKKLIVELTLDSADFRKGLVKATGSVKKAKGATKGLNLSVVKLAAGFISAQAAIAIFRGGMRLLTSQTIDSIRSFAQFESGIAKVNTLLTGQGTAALEGIQAELLQLDSILGGTKDLTEATYQAISAGVEPAEAVAFVAKAAKLAKAGFTDMASAVDATTTVINAYGLEIGDTVRIMDVFITTQRLGKTTVDEFGAVIGTVLPLAAAAGVNIETVGAAVATLTAAGIDTNRAMTGLRAIFASLIKITPDAAKQADELGIEFSIAALKSKGLARFLRDVTKATKGSTEKLGRLFPNIEAIVPVLALGGAQAGKFADALVEMADAGGATQEAFEKITGVLSARFQGLLDEVERLRIEIVTEFGPALLSLVENSGDVVKAMRAWVEVNKQFIALKITESLLFLVDSMQLVIDLGLGLRKMWFDLIAFGGALTQVVLDLATAMSFVALGFGSAGQIIRREISKIRDDVELWTGEQLQASDAIVDASREAATGIRVLRKLIRDAASDAAEQAAKISDAFKTPLETFQALERLKKLSLDIEFGITPESRERQVAILKEMQSDIDSFRLGVTKKELAASELATQKILEDRRNMNKEIVASIGDRIQMEGDLETKKRAQQIAAELEFAGRISAIGDIIVQMRKKGVDFEIDGIRLAEAANQEKLLRMQEIEAEFDALREARAAKEAEELFMRVEANNQFLFALAEQNNLFRENELDLNRAIMDELMQLGVGAFVQIQAAVSDAVFLAIKGGEDIKKVWQSLGDALLKSVVDAFVQIATNIILNALVSKAFARSEAADAAAVAAVNALKSMAGAPFPINLTAPAFSGFIGGIGAAIAAKVGAGGAPGRQAGDDFVRRTGAFTLHRGERVVPEETNRDLTDFLRGPGGRTVGATTINLTIGEFVGDEEQADRMAARVLEAIELRGVEV